MAQNNCVYVLETLDEGIRFVPHHLQGRPAVSMVTANCISCVRVQFTMNNRMKREMDMRNLQFTHISTPEAEDTGV